MLFTFIELHAFIDSMSQCIFVISSLFSELKKRREVRGSEATGIYRILGNVIINCTNIWNGKSNRPFSPCLCPTPCLETPHHCSQFSSVTIESQNDCSSPRPTRSQTNMHSVQKALINPPLTCSLLCAKNRLFIESQLQECHISTYEKKEGHAPR